MDTEARTRADALAGLAQRYRSAVAKQTATLVEGAGSDTDIRLDIIRLAGAGARFGHTALCDALGQLVEEGPSEAVRVALLEAASAPPDEVPHLASVARGLSVEAGLVCVVDADPGTADEVGGTLRQSGYPVQVYLSASGLAAALKAGVTPAAVVVGQVPDHPVLPKAELAPFPIVRMCNQSDVDSRLSAVRLGHRVVFALPPADIEPLVDLLDFLMCIQQPVPLRALVVDDDPLTGEWTRIILEAAGMDVRIASGLDQVLDPLDVFRPDVIAVSSTLEGTSAGSVVAVVRQDDRHLATPVVGLCSGIGGAQPNKGGEALPRVFVGDLRLPYLIREHGRRARRLGEGSIRDELTGILTTSRFRERLDHEVARCLRHGLVVSMGVVEVNDFGSLNERNGRVAGGRVMATLAQVLRTRLRRTDIIGRLGVDRVGVLMPHTTSLMAQRVMEQAREQMGSVRFTGKGGKLFTVTLSGGISTCPVHVQPSQLQQAAVRALEEARAQGSSRVVREEDIDRR